MRHQTCSGTPRSKPTATDIIGTATRAAGRLATVEGDCEHFFNRARAVWVVRYGSPFRFQQTWTSRRGRSCVSRVRGDSAEDEVHARGISPALCARLSPVLSTFLLLFACATLRYGFGGSSHAPGLKDPPHLGRLRAENGLGRAESGSVSS